MNDIIFQKQNGGMGRPAANEDGISGLLMAITDVDTAGFDPVAVGAGTLHIATLHYADQLSAQYGVAETPVSEAALTAAEAAANAVVYHVREFFRLSPTGTLYVGIKSAITPAEILALQGYAEGKIRQAGIFVASPTEGDIAGYQSAATALEAAHKPLSIIVGRGKGALTFTQLTTTPASAADAPKPNVSVLVGCDLAPAVVTLLGGDAKYALYGCVGNALGALSKAMVHESIAWVQKFPLGLQVPGFITGDVLKEVDVPSLTPEIESALGMVQSNRYLFVRTHEGASDCYYNDSMTLDAPTSDYAYIENVRTMDKATRGIRAQLLPYLSAPLYVDSATGKLRADTVASLETTAGHALEDMEKAGELSGYLVEIDPEQNVLATSTLEIQIKNVPVGVMRKVVVKIGMTTKIN
jgi:hypothetical protein